jgi:hypothetical protein
MSRSESAITRGKPQNDAVATYLIFVNYICIYIYIVNYICIYMT